MNLAAGQLVWAWITGIHKRCRRICVVTRVTATTVEVVYGQGKPWLGCSKPVMVPVGSLLGQRMQLSKDTHFCGSQTIPIADVDKVLKDVCPLSAFPKFEAVAIEGRRQIARRIQARRAAAQPSAPTQATAPGASPRQPQQQLQAPKPKPNGDSDTD